MTKAEETAVLVQRARIYAHLSHSAAARGDSRKAVSRACTYFAILTQIGKLWTPEAPTYFKAGGITRGPNTGETILPKR